MDSRARAATLVGAVLVAGLAGHEGRELVDYWDRIPVTPVATACYGHTATAKVGTVRSADECDKLLHKDLTTIYGPAVIDLTHGHVTQGQFNALTDFAYNLGIENLRRSTLLRKHNAGDYAGAAEEFPKWRFAGGKDCAVRASNCYGIVKRRAWEHRQYVY